jgi:hypothetical protein
MSYSSNSETWDETAEQLMRFCEESADRVEQMRVQTLAEVDRLRASLSEAEARLDRIGYMAVMRKLLGDRSGVE